MNAKKRSQTAAEFKAKLEADPVFQAEQGARNKANLERTDHLNRVSQTLIKELKVAGVELRSIGSRFNSPADRKTAIPILRHHLNLDYPKEILEAIARALAIPEAINCRPEFIAMFMQAAPGYEGFRYALGLAIAATTTQENLDETIALLRDRSLRESRLSLLLAIRKIRSKENIKKLINELRNDPDLAIELASWK